MYKYHRVKLAKQGPLRPVVPGAPYERWYINLTGPHLKSEKGNIWILTYVDLFTKWIEAFPLRNKETETIAKVLVEQIFARFGTQLSILSDQGKEVFFQSRIFQPCIFDGPPFSGPAFSVVPLSTVK